MMEYPNMHKDEMLNKKVWAVIGASSNKEKFGYKIFKKLEEKGYDVYGINPNVDKIDGKKIYKTVKDLPVKPDVVDFVVSPQITEGMLEDLKDMGIENLWFQPGSYRQSTVEKGEKLGFKLVYNDCVLRSLH
jgi:hypothetical protein